MVASIHTRGQWLALAAIFVVPLILFARGCIDPFVPPTPAAVLFASDGGKGDDFGMSVAVEGETVVVGAPQRNERAGGAFVFVRPASGWQGRLAESARLVPSTGTGHRDFGISVAISGNVIAVGTWDESQDRAVYVFERPPDGWSGEIKASATLQPTMRGEEDSFGVRVSICNDTIAVGAPGYDDHRGVVYIFVRPTGGWRGRLTEAAVLTDDRKPNANLGARVVIAGKHVLASGAGSVTGDLVARIYRKPQTGWSGFLRPVGRLQPKKPPPRSDFGYGLSFDEETAVVGDGNESAVHVFAKPPGGWSGSRTPDATLFDPEGPCRGPNRSGLGITVAVSQKNVVALRSWGKTDAALLFHHGRTDWADVREPRAILSNPPTGRYNYAAAIESDTIVLGSREAEEAHVFVGRIRD